MHDFGFYFTLGRQHITNLHSLEHILLVTALCLRYLFNDWKKLLILITAFTIGHSLTMVLSMFNIIRISSYCISFLIPVTIIITAITNVFVKKFVYKHKYQPIYFLALFFGLIHGLSFSNYLNSLSGRGGNIIVNLFAYNIGIEVGQLLVVLAILLLTFVCINILKINRREYILFLSGGVLAVAIQMALQRIPF